MRRRLPWPVDMHVYWVGVAADLWRGGDASLEWMLRDAAAGEISTTDLDAPVRGFGDSQ